MKSCARAPLGTAGLRLILGFLVAGSLVLAPGVADAKKAKKAEKTTTLDDSASSGESVKLEESTDVAPPAPAEEPKPKADDEDKPRVKHVIPPYSLPWQLRPVLPTTMVRSDTSVSFYGVGGSTVASLLGGSYKIIPQVAIFGKIAVASDSPPANQGTGTFVFANPLLGGQLGLWPTKTLKLGVSLGFTLPIGMGGTTAGDRAAIETNGRAMLARSGFDNALFMPDYLGILPGVDVAWVTHNLTLQAEVNLGFLVKVRGLQTEKSSSDDLSLGLHAGYFLFPFLSAGLDFRYQNWIGKPDFVIYDPTGASVDNVTLAVGPRFHINVTDTIRFRPGFSLAFGLDDPIAGSHYKTLQFDLPLTF